jgi:16S rRNA (uracil1498-N3)-methyltransferase
MSTHRLHVPACAAGGLVPLTDDVAHHALHVLRLKPGAVLRVFDGAGHEYAATLDGATSKGARVLVGEVLAPLPESPLRITLAFAPLSADLTTLVVQKAIELGVSALWPLKTARTEAPGRACLAQNRMERWHRVAVSAAGQCGRAWVPEVRPVDFDEILTVPLAGPKILCCERALARPFPVQATPTREVLVAIGPVGGWEDGELERAATAGFSLATLGPRVLRAETAAIVALSVVQLLWGDLTQSPRE